VDSSIPALSTATVDSVSALGTRGVKWIVEILDTAGNLVLAEEVFGTSGTGTPVAGTVYSIVGDPMLVTTNVALVGTDTALNITNNSADNLLVSLTREELDVPASLFPPTTCNSGAPTCGPSSECSILIPFTQTTITPGATATVDTINVIGFRAAKWNLVITNPTAGTEEGYQALMTFKIGTPPYINSYAFIGDVINHTLSFFQSGINLSLQVTNNEANNIVVYLAEVPVSA